MSVTRSVSASDYFYVCYCFSGCLVQIWAERKFDPHRIGAQFQCDGLETGNWCINKPVPLLTQSNVTYDSYISGNDYNSYISDTVMNVNWAWVKPFGEDGFVRDSASSIRCDCPVEFDFIEYDNPRNSWVLNTDFDESSGKLIK